MNIRHFSAQLDIFCTGIGVIHSRSGVSRCCWRARSRWCRSRSLTALPLSLQISQASAKNRVCIQGSGQWSAGFQYQRLNRNCHSSSLSIARACICCRLDASKSVGGKQLHSSSVKYQWPCCSAVCSHRYTGESNVFVY
jgi:hypothetical protein